MTEIIPRNQNDIVNAMKEKNTLKLQTLRGVKGEIDLEHINKKVEILKVKQQSQISRNADQQQYSSASKSFHFVKQNINHLHTCNILHLYYTSNTFFCQPLLYNIHPHFP